MKKITYILALLSAAAFFSCEKVFIEKDLKTDDPVENFEYLWKQCDEKCVLRIQQHRLECDT